MGAIIATVILSGRALGPLAKLGQTLGRANTAYVAYSNLKVFLSAKRLDSHNTHSGLEVTSELAIEVSNATLRLTELGRPIFNNLNIQIRKGEKVAVVGKTGSGKSTLVRLLAGIAEPETGSISINGRDIRRYSRADIFRTIGVVFQEPWLFSGTLRDNITMGHEDCSTETALESLQSAGADFIKLDDENALNIFISDRGNNLSGGQKQAIVIARALAFNPDSFILDEPTSAMDVQMEALVIRNLFNSMKEKTMVIVAHKTNIVEVCDRVVVMDHGKIVADVSRDKYFEAMRKQNEQT
jgi:ATP-binding cassette subfamily C protein LapB